MRNLALAAMVVFGLENLDRLFFEGRVGLLCWDFLARGVHLFTA